MDRIEYDKWKRFYIDLAWKSKFKKENTEEEHYFSGLLKKTYEIAEYFGHEEFLKILYQDVIFQKEIQIEHAKALIAEAQEGKLRYAKKVTLIAKDTRERSAMLKFFDQKMISLQKIICKLNGEIGEELEKRGIKALWYLEDEVREMLHSIE
jgi:hypothetical protein